MEARAQAPSEIFERNIKNRIIAQGLCLPALSGQEAAALLADKLFAGAIA